MSTPLRPALTDAGLVALALADAVFSSAREGGYPLVLSVVAGLGLAVRRRWPYVAFALTMPALWAAYVLVAPVVALYTVAARDRARAPVVVCAILTAAGYYLPWPIARFDLRVSSRELLGLVYTIVYVGAPLGLGLLSRTRRVLADQLAELTAGRAREEHLQAERALTQERARLAREMHDVVSHQVSLIAVQAGALRVTARDDATREAAGTIRELSVRTLDELRRMIGVLRATGGAPVDLAPQPRLTDIPRLVRESGLDVAVDLSAVAGRSWAEPTERAAYRTVQEGLTNVGKHAPGASVSVQASPHGTGLLVTVRNGPSAGEAPAPLPESGHGLLGLRERAELLGGTLWAGPTPDGGFLIRADLPDAVVEGADPASAGADPAERQSAVGGAGAEHRGTERPGH
ncbi:sensor histidine kinase [Georgenia yuyongxinii]|uniref:histidine kinase n=1 Tax=Georgenia yuyongxinii TaxID=2589797 RepID=A0A552WPC1_9MICO|nr:histidine kinase [Georgenia yuyongxinii]TRW44567.1 two-component sensor histidine kinase [Georgenia yuyongxinii]